MDEMEATRARAQMEAIQNLFQEPGWIALTQEFKNEIEVIKEQMLTVENWDDVCFNKGKIQQLLDMLYLPEIINNMLTHALEEETEGDDAIV